MARPLPPILPEAIDGDYVRAVWGQLAAGAPTPAQERACRRIAAAVLTLERDTRRAKAAAYRLTYNRARGHQPQRRLPEDAIVAAYRDDPTASTTSVAEAFGIVPSTVSRVLERHGVARRPVGRPTQRTREA